MKRTVVAILAALSLVLAVSAFAIEGTQPFKETDGNFEQMKTNLLKKLDEKISSLQEEKTCAQAAKNQSDLMACSSKRTAEMRGHHEQMKMPGGPGSMGGGVPAK